jgi:hypothetical protein
MSGQSFIPPREQLPIFNADFFRPCAVEYIGITGSTGASFTGPTGGSFTGPTGSSFTGPTGASSSTGPTGIGSSTGPTGGISQLLTLIQSTGLNSNSSIFSNVFTSTYDVYRINLSNLSTNSSNQTTLQFRLSSNGVTNTANEYYSRNYFQYGTSAGQFGQYAAQSTSSVIGILSNTANTGLFLELYAPSIVCETSYNFSGFLANGVNRTMTIGGGEHNVNGAFDGIEIFGSGYNIIASCQIYGYNK